MHATQGVVLGIGVTVFCTGLPILLTDHYAFAASLIILGIGIVISSFLMPKQIAAVPDVSLDLVKPSSLVLTTTGADAFDIQIDPVSTGDSVHDYLDAFPVPGRGKVTGAIVTKATNTTFPFTPVVRIGEPQLLTPLVEDQLFLSHGPSLTIHDFMKRKFSQRHTDELREFVEESKQRTMPERERADRLDRLERPIEAKLVMTYCDKPNGRKDRHCWRKTETLHYDSRRTPPILQVRHAGEPVNLAPA